ncbi:MAG: hypothetical protein O3B87_03510, partial [bacterium]|nr:hypothetical protein [bacterium]
GFFMVKIMKYNEVRMKHTSRRVIVFFIVSIVFIAFLLNYIYSNSRATRITSDEEYIEQLRLASINKKLAGFQNIPTPTLTEERPIESLFQSILSWFGL